MFATIDWDAMLTVIWSSLLAGIGATAAYGLAILGGSRAIELGRSGRLGVAAVYGLIGALGVAMVVASIVFGIVVLSSK
jgi:hypothetical protein